MKFIALLICLCFCINATIAQTHMPLIKKHKNAYSWKGTTYKFSEMGHVFDEDIEMKNQYLFARKTFSNVKNLGWTSISSTIVGAGLLQVEIELSGGYLSRGESTGIGSIASILIIIVAPIAGIASTIKLLQYQNQKNKLIKTFNQSINKKTEALSQTSLKLGPTTNGFGLTLSF